MGTLIGDGAHATDIWATLNQSQWQQVAHHTDFRAEGPYIIGINAAWLRAEIAEKIGYPDQPWVHPTVTFGPACRWGHGTHINYAVSMTRTRIGHHSTISPGVTICDRVHIGDNVTIGAGTLILPEAFIPDGTTWVGKPARHLR